MATFRRGAGAVQAAAVKNTGSGTFKPVFKFEQGVKYLQFLTPFDESDEGVVTVLMHQFITVGHREDGNPIYERFISRRDPDLDGPEGYDELWDRFESKPSERSIAVAVELEPVWETVGTKKRIVDWDVAMREYTDKEGNEKEVPNVALVIESPYTLYGQLASLNDMKPIEDYVWAINVTGKGTAKTFTATDVGEALDFGEELDEFLEEIDFEGWLEDLSDEERMRELISPLPDDFVVNPYAKRGKGKEKKTSSSSSSSSRTTRSRREVAEEETPAPRSRRTRTSTSRSSRAEESVVEERSDEGDGSGTEEEASTTRKRRFADLRNASK